MEQDYDSPTDYDEHIVNEDDCAPDYDDGVDDPDYEVTGCEEFEDASDPYDIEYDY